MKKLFCTALLAVPLLSPAQLREKAAIEITPIIGKSSSLHTHSFWGGSASVSGVQLGVYGDYYFTDRWSLRSGLLYQRMGAKELDFFIFNDDYSERTNYLSLPVAVNFHFGRKRNWYINYGLSVGALLKAKVDYSDGNGEVTITDQANAFQFGLISGFGYKIPVSPNLSLQLDNSNFAGFTPTTQERKGSNFYMSFNIGIVFNVQ